MKLTTKETKDVVITTEETASGIHILANEISILKIDKDGIIYIYHQSDEEIKKLKALGFKLKDNQVEVAE